jgi:DNA replication protein DnaC
MQHLPPTAEIEAAIVKTKLAWDELRRADPQGEMVFQAVPLREYNRWIGLLPFAYRRDAIQATRPDGCWCLGFGGWNPKYEREGHVIASAPFCGCADGQAMAELARSIAASNARARLADVMSHTGIPSHIGQHSFGSFPGAPEALPTFSRIREWARGDDRARGRSLMVWGAASRGKTVLCACALKTRIESSLLPGTFLEVPSWIESVRAANNPENFESARDREQRAVRVPLLMLDDVGKEYHTDYSRDVLFRVIAARHREGRVTIFTTNESPAGLAAKYGDWFMDRISEMCAGGYWVLHMEGPGLREIAA